MSILVTDHVLRRQFFAANPIRRYAIGDRDALRFNSDGSLDLLIRRERPEGDTSNWLPAPESGRFTMNVRLYYPDLVALEGSRRPPVVRRVVD
ncbi:DUF1214 domain-containing protein [Paraburkholderia sp. EG287A]|uniref:DUF1214 domain-containing protein n=1 Tax=unclassified Paraburkholderia TaxID=2615204 RepID=UPI0034D2B622